MSSRTAERSAYVFSLLVTILIMSPAFLIVIFIFARGLSAINWEFLTDLPRQGGREGGIFPAIVGTLLLMGGTILFSLPVGVLSAIYLTEYARRSRLTRLIRLSIVNMAGVPSIVYGLFGLGLFVIFLNFQTSVLSGSLTLALLVLPIIITATEEALLSVPQSFREASIALGATRWQTVYRVVLPNALPGIITGSVLGLGRAAGETAPILFTAAAFYLPRLPNSIFSPVMALPYHLYIVATQVTNMPEEKKWGTALVLMVLVLLLTLVATVVRTRFRLRKKW